LLSALIGHVLASTLIAAAQHMRTMTRMTTTGRTPPQCCGRST
jgi:type IV secretion system protein VirD4